MYVLYCNIGTVGYSIELKAILQTIEIDTLQYGIIKQLLRI